MDLDIGFPDAMSRITQLNEAELDEVFTRSGGPGGQNVNKVSTRVTLRHIPTGITVNVQDSRSQAVNRQLARERLRAALQAREREARDAARGAREKLRRQNAPRPQGLKARILQAKHHRSRLKASRRQKED